MNKTLKTILPLAGGLAAACAAAAFLTAPGRYDKTAAAPFINRNFAHRGLHDQRRTVPENSLAAFRLAKEHGYGVELDVHLTLDNKLVVFHDDTTDRVCGVPGRVEDMSWPQLSALRLCGTDERMPLLREVLELMGGKYPIIVELKRGSRNVKLCRMVLRELEQYSGPVCIESFDPFIVAWFRKHAPGILRGQLTDSPKNLSKGASWPESLALGNLLTNFLARPQFIAHGPGRKTLLCRLCEAMGALRFAWTAHSRARERDNDSVIFEFYRPAPKFRD